MVVDKNPGPRATFARRLGAISIDWLFSLLFAVAFFAGANVASLAFFALMRIILVATIGMTIGQRIMKIRVIHVSRNFVGFRAAVVRTGLEMLVLPALITTETGEHLHDRLAGTEIVRI